MKPIKLNLQPAIDIRILNQTKLPMDLGLYSELVGFFIWSGPWQIERALNEEVYNEINKENSKN